ncbi:MAG: amino acid adenylation domain-containing protein [Pseudonocardiaceae bacterium]|nr:amino acid adenylation domain-containing protein [Pseudonocardiaceae bacterium]
MLGDFTSLLLLACHTEPADDFRTLIRRIQQRLADDLEHRDFSAVDVQRELARRHGPSNAVMPVVFTSLLGVEDGSIDEATRTLGSLVGGLSQTPQVWLDHQVMEIAGGVQLTWDAVDELFPPGVLDAMFAAYQRMLEALVGGKWSDPLPDLLPPEQREVRELVNATAAPVPADALHEPFFAFAREHPQWTALISGDERWSYGEAADRALRVAAWLRAEGVADHDAVGVCIPKGPAQIAAVLGILAAGGVYVPIGVDQPPARRQRIEHRAGVRLTLTAEDVATVATARPLAEPRVADSDTPAYVIFTSGSTGEPKGVEVSHQAAHNTVADITHRYGIDPGDRVLAVSALEFDLSVFDIFGVLSVGAGLVLVDEHERRDADRWHELVSRHRVTVWNTVPALLDMLLTAGPALDSVRLALVSGDWVDPQLGSRFAEATGGRGRLVALGGATEAAIWSNACEVPDRVPAGWTAVPYGMPLTNQRYRVVDEAGRDCPDWVTGELWIGGYGVALGYRGDPETTARKFVDHRGQRWYRTGDLGRYWPDGTLEFLGRRDQQVKIRGHRVELGEIETTLDTHPHVTHSVALTVGEANQRRLAAAVVPTRPTPETAASPAEDGPVDDSPADWKLEGELTASLVHRLLTGIGVDPDGPTPNDAQLTAHGAVSGQFGLIRRWHNWLAQQENRAPDPVGRAAGTHFADTVDRLLARESDLIAMLTGLLDPTTLLDDPVLAPEAQFLRHPTIVDTVDEVAARIAELDRPVRVAELGARTGRAAARLLASLPDGVHYTLLDSSDALLATAHRRLASYPVDYHRLPADVVPDELRHRFDVVLAVAALHRYPDVSTAVEQASALLAPGGRVFAIEATRLAPLSLLTVGILEHGFSQLDPARRSAGSPLLEAGAWRTAFGAAGFQEVAVHRRPASAVLLSASRPTDQPALTGAVLRDWAAEQLPAHMIPERYVVLGRLPLTSNGKVDRAALARLLDEPAAPADFAPPHGAVEQAVATAWGEVLGAESISRTADFFVFGGDSLAATRVVARLRAMGLTGATVGALFAHPVLAEFASRLHAGEPVTDAGALAADPERRNEPFPLTEVQRAYWLGRRDDVALGGVAAHCFFEFEGAELDLDRLEDAWNRLIARHEMLRAIIDTDGQQRILPTVPRFRLPVTDAIDETTASTQLRDVMSQQVFTLSEWPLFDARAVRYPGGVRLGISLDNIILDGLSMLIVFAELARLYADPDTDLPSVDVSFRDCVLAVPEDGAILERAEAYWRERLPELPSAPQLPLARDPAQVSRPRFVRRERRVSGAQWSLITSRARRVGLTPSVVLLACYAEVLSTWSAAPALTVNLTLFDRPRVHPDVEQVLGDFTSLSLLEHRPTAGESWLEAARRLQAQLGRDLEHRAASAVWVQREFARQGGAGEAVMPVVFTSALGVNDELLADLPKEFPRLVGGLSQTPQVWLDHQVMEYGGELLLTWDAVEELFPPGVLDAMFAAYQRLVDWLSETDDWSQVTPELLPADQRWVRERVNATAAPESGRMLHEGFFDRASEAPERIALWARDGTSLRYGELAERALRVAGWLATQGIGPGDPVAVRLPKGVEQITAVLGVLAAGGVYVPIGPDQPSARRDRMCAAAGVRLTIDDLDAALGAPRDTPVLAGPSAPAYVIFTSGSTGEPKGVEVTHRAAVNTIDDINERFTVGPADRVLAVSALDFDLSVYDIFGLLSVGGSLVLPDETERRDPRAWAALLTAHSVTIWNTVPALLDMLLRTTEPPRSLRLGLVSGDWVGLDLGERLAEATGRRARLVALGGATEAAIWSNAFEVGHVPANWSSIPYGFPLRNQRYRVVDARGRDRPDWVPGELWIGGSGLATGYRGDPDTTDAKFVEHRGQRWYRTGDIGRYWPDGTLEFLGRSDQQVKIRGHRIELGEVEAALEAHPRIEQAVAVATGERGHRRLQAFVLAPDADLDRVPEFLAQHLPEAAIPGRLTVLETMPLTTNGKIDRAALARLTEGAEGAEYQPPVGELENRLAALWSELLDVPRVGRGDEFLLLGGDSLLGMRLLSAIEEQFGVRLPLRDLLRGCSIQDLASAVTTNQQLTDSVEEGVL